MKRSKVIFTCLVLILWVAAAGHSAAPDGAAAFEKLKALAGRWQTAPGSEEKSTLDIELTAAGKTVMERFHMERDGKPVEMMTMYYLDGGQIKLTHYCEAGNQPTMAGSYSPEAGTLTFHFVSATNLKSPDDGHMYHAVYTFVDRDHFKMRWTFRKDQKDAFTEDTSYVRVK